ncbi:hypothetical protein OIV83_002772 [Microbotryomycetes sp. JL201]|nr:hypothetical protein OIV83_002772 [Microbotryomycetes sp. JL201]
MPRLVQFKAGRCERQGNTNTVVPVPGRGLITIEEEDGLLHFRFKDLDANAVIEDLILFEGDASFIKASERVHCLKFSSSSARSFYWHQNVDPSKDAENARRVNELIGGTVDQEGSAMDVEGEVTAAPIASTSTTAPAPAPFETPAPQTRQASSSSDVAPAAPRKAIGSDQQLAQLQDILAGLRGQAGPKPEFTLPDVLPPSEMQAILYTNPSLATKLYPFLPPEIPKTFENVLKALTSPEFQRTLSSLDRALRTGATGPLMSNLGLPRDAALGVENFLEEIQKQADKEKEENGKDEAGGAGVDEDVKMD